MGRTRDVKQLTKNTGSMNKRHLTISFFSVFVLAGMVLNSCYYDSEEYLFPESGTDCDTSDVTFGATIQPMLQSYCYSCHSNSNASGNGAGIRLENYSDVKTMADNGRLLGSISHENGYSPMPKGGSKLSDCQISQTQVWIENGTPNN